MKKTKVTKRVSKAVVTQDNRFIYAKYDMNANEMKFFMWIVAQINSVKDEAFKACEIPLSEVFEIFNHKNEDNHTYIKKLIGNMAKKVYVEDFKLLDEKTLKQVEIHRAMPLFQWIQYQKGESCIHYKLNDSLTEYLININKNFTQLKFSDIQQMKSAYSIRIYNMLVCELKQNRQSLKINLAVLQNILEVPKSLYEWFDFKRKALNQAQKDINAKSNLVLFEIKTYKTGRKITDLEFIFDYKNNDKRIQRDADKRRSYNEKLLEILESYIGKRIFLKDYGKLICEGRKWDENMQNVSLVCRHVESDERFVFKIKEFKDIENLEKHKKRAEELFYLDEENLQKVVELRKSLESGSLFDRALTQKK